MLSELGVMILGNIGASGIELSAERVSSGMKL